MNCNCRIIFPLKNHFKLFFCISVVKNSIFIIHEHTDKSVIGKLKCNFCEKPIALGRMRQHTGAHIITQKIRRHLAICGLCLGTGCLYNNISNDHKTSHTGLTNDQFTPSKKK